MNNVYYVFYVYSETLRHLYISIPALTSFHLLLHMSNSQQSFKVFSSQPMPPDMRSWGCLLPKPRQQVAWLDLPMGQNLCPPSEQFSFVNIYSNDNIWSLQQSYMQTRCNFTHSAIAHVTCMHLFS